MPHSTAGEASGAEPTYWVKWSSIWATRASGTWARTHSATVRPGRRPNTSPSLPPRTSERRSTMSQSEPTERQKKKRSEMACSLDEKSRNPW